MNQKREGNCLPADQVAPASLSIFSSLSWPKEKITYKIINSKAKQTYEKKL
jgi:hypothetical protein